MAKNVIELILTGKDLSGDALGKVDANLDRVGKRMQRTGAIAVGLGLAMAAGFGLTVKAAADVEAGVKNALTLVDEQGERFAQMESDMTTLAGELSRELGQSGKDISVGFYQVLSSGAEASTEGFESLTRTALKLAKTVELETAQSVEILSDTIHAFGGELEQAEEFADAFFQTSKLTATTVPQLAEAMRTAAPAAAALGINLKNTFVTLAALAAQGVKASEAGVAFRQIMIRLAAPTSEARDQLERLNVELFEQDGSIRNILDVYEDFREGLEEVTDKQRTQILETVAGARAFTKFGIILNTSDETMRKWAERIDKAGALQKAFETKMSSLSGQMQILRANVESLQIEIGKALVPAVKTAVAIMTPAIARATEWAAAHQELVQVAAVLTIALVGAGGLAAAIGTTTRVLAFLNVTWAALLIQAVPVVGAIAAITAGIGLFAGAVKVLRPETERLSMTLADIEKRKNLKIKIEAEIDDDIAKFMKLEGASKEEIDKFFSDFMRDLAAAAPSDLKGFEIQDFGIFSPKLLAEVRVNAIKMRNILLVELSHPDIGETIDRLAEKLNEIGEGGRLKIIDKDQRVELEKAFETIQGLGEELDRLAATAGSEFSKTGDAIAEAMTPDPEVLRFQMEQALKEAFDNLEIPEVDLTQAFTAADVQGIQKLAGMIQGSFGAMFSKIQQDGANAFDAVVAGVKSFAADVINHLLRIAAQWLAVKIIFGTGLFGAGGLSFLSFVPGIPGAEHGGVIRGGVRGRDTVPILARRDEAFLDQGLTSKLDAFLTRQDEFVGMLAEQGPLHVTFQSQFSASTATESIRNARMLRNMMSRRGERTASGVI